MVPGSPARSGVLACRSQGSSAIVSGAASGLGAATAAALAAAGVHVVGLDLASGWERTGAPATGDFTAVPGDVTSAADVAAAVARASREGPLRIAVNCAGVGHRGAGAVPQGRSRSGCLRQRRRGQPDRHVQRAAAGGRGDAATEPVDDQGQRGLIVNTASVAAFDGQVGQIAYSASKGGVVGMTLPAARDLAQFGIRVMTIAPGILDTPMMAAVTEEFRVALAGERAVPDNASAGRKSMRRWCCRSPPRTT